MYDGLVVVDKPPGWTSHDVVAKLRKAYGQRRIGHAGTLDPDATGVLLVGAGRATRLLRFLQNATKAYRAEIVFGVATTTLDAAGDIVDRQEMSITPDDLTQVAARFVGEIEQVPPMVSAVKVGGRRLHELARLGVEVDRDARRVRVDRLDVESFEPGAYPRATVVVECSSGTYVRSLAADLGTALGGCAHVATLRRLRVGSFVLDEAHPLDAVLAEPQACLLPPLVAVRDLPRVDATAELTRGARHGVTFAVSAFTGVPASSGPVALVDPAGQLLAVYERTGSALRPLVVVSDAAGC
ncbi:MAG: tRNA pseudouridine(55) synthase TruB [Actinobacteria bacterium]|nr:MAG: tRNA pseudouridine(55) synthase TruB [Actinomycetota bacterium]